MRGCISLGCEKAETRGPMHPEERPEEKITRLRTYQALPIYDWLLWPLGAISYS